MRSLRLENQSLQLGIGALTLTLFALLFSCGNSHPPVTLDTSAANNTPYADKNFALLEIHRAWTGDSFGISIDKTLGESEFCTVLVLDKSEAITSTECLQNQFGSYDLKNMEIHLKPPGQISTSSIQVKAISKVDAEKDLVYLDLGSSKPATELGKSFMKSELKIKRSQLVSGLTATTVGFNGPDKKGIARLQVLAVTVNESIEALSSSTHEAEEKIPEEVTRTVDNSEIPLSVDAAQAKDDYINSSHKLRIFGPSTNTCGTILFIDQKPIGLTKRDGDSTWAPSL